MTTQVTKGAVLLILDAGEDPIPARTIRLALNVEYRIRATMADLDALLRQMEDAKLVIGLTCDKEVLWSIAVAGRAWLAEHVH